MRLVELCKDSTNYDNDKVNLVFETTRLMIQKGRAAIKSKYFQSLSKEADMVVASMVKSERLFDIVVKETEEMINMCESLDKWEKETLLKMVKEMLEKGLSEDFILSFTNINKRVLSQAKELIQS